MLLDIIAEAIGKFIGDSFKNKSQFGLIIAVVISLLCLIIAIALFLNGKYAISLIFIVLGLLPVYIRTRYQKKYNHSTKTK
jgi:ABC-type antimicrobial peptide transport system permease subunit